MFALKNYYLDLYRTGKKTIVLGDWNDDLDASTFNGIETPFQDFLDAPNDYFFPTKQLSDEGKRSYAFYAGSFLDHIMINGPLINDYISESAVVLDMMPSYISGYTQNTSDHYPVISSFYLANINSLSSTNEQFAPLIFAQSANGEKVFASGEWEGTVEIYSVTGAKIGVYEKQSGMLEIPVVSLPHGMYIAHLQSDRQGKSFNFIR